MDFIDDSWFLGELQEAEYAAIGVGGKPLWLLILQRVSVLPGTVQVGLHQRL